MVSTVVFDVEHTTLLSVVCSILYSVVKKSFLIKKISAEISVM